MILTRVTYDATVDRLMSVCSFRIRANLPDLAVKADVDTDNDTHWHIAVDDLGYASAARLYNQLSSLGCAVVLFFGDTLIAETPDLGLGFRIPLG